MRSLSAFQDAFAAALDGPAHGLAPWLAGAEAAPGLTVYRNTVAKGRADALAANFPAVGRLVGDEWFAAAALAFARTHPPRQPSLLAYGAEFPDWLARFEPAQTLPYLADVAWLDRLWTEAHLAGDAEALTLADLVALDAERLEATVARLHPSARIAWFDDNTPSLWLANRADEPQPEVFELGGAGEGVLVVRPAGAVAAHLLSRPEHAFLAGCAAGASLAASAALALEADPHADLPAVLQRLVGAGALARLVEEKEGA